MAEMAGSGARCAIHADVAATLICDRCGNFMCSECSLGGTRSICPTCAALVGTGAFPFTRDNWEFGKVWDFAWSAFKREWLMLSVAVLVSIMIAGMLSAVVNGIQSVVTSATKSIAAIAIGTLATQLIAIMVQGLFEMGLFRICLDVLAGQKADIGRLFSQFNKAGVMVAQKLLLYALFLVPLTGYFAVLTGVAIALSGGSIDLNDPTHLLDHLGDSQAPFAVFLLGTLLVLFPVIYVWLPFSFATPELVYVEGVGAIESLRNCWTIAKGFRLSIFGFVLLFILIIFLGVLACCIGFLPAAALVNLLISTLYLALRTGSSLPKPATTDI
jgi:hypothetical protein